MRKIFLMVAAVLLLGFIVAPTHKSSAQIYPGQCTAGNGASQCSPTQLGASAITLPVSGTSALTNIIDVRQAKESSLLWSCTQTATVIVTLYQEDGATSFQNYTPTATAAALGMLMIGSERGPLLDSGGAVTGSFAYPQRAIAFSWHNSTATAGTCTARLYLQYR